MSLTRLKDTEVINNNNSLSVTLYLVPSSQAGYDLFSGERVMGVNRINPCPAE